MIDVRGCRDEAEKQLSLDIYNAVSDEPATMEDVLIWERRAFASADLLAFVDGRAVGSCAAAIQHNHPELAMTLLTVLPDARRRGAGSALCRAVSEWAGAQGVTMLETRVDGDDDESLGFAERRGFRVHKREPGLVLDLLATTKPAIDPPHGIDVVPYAPPFARGVYDVRLETHPDVPGDEDWTPEPFNVWLTSWEPETTFVALASGDVVGFAKLHVRTGRPGIATHYMTGVKRDWRGRGVGGALKRAQIAWAKEAGLERLETTNEERNEPIRRLNLGLGYREAPGRLWLRGPVRQ